MINNGVGSWCDTTSIKRRLARLIATYSKHRASGLSGNVVPLQGITMALSHSSPLALWMMLSVLCGGRGRE